MFETDLDQCQSNLLLAQKLNNLSQRMQEQQQQTYEPPYNVSMQWMSSDRNYPINDSYVPEVIRNHLSTDLFFVRFMP